MIENQRENQAISGLSLAATKVASLIGYLLLTNFFAKDIIPVDTRT